MRYQLAVGHPGHRACHGLLLPPLVVAGHRVTRSSAASEGEGEPAEGGERRGDTRRDGDLLASRPSPRRRFPPPPERRLAALRPSWEPRGWPAPRREAGPSRRVVLPSYLAAITMELASSAASPILTAWAIMESASASENFGCPAGAAATGTPSDVTGTTPVGGPADGRRRLLPPRHRPLRLLRPRQRHDAARPRQRRQLFCLAPRRPSAAAASPGAALLPWAMVWAVAAACWVCLATCAGDAPRDQNATCLGSSWASSVR